MKNQTNGYSRQMSLIAPSLQTLLWCIDLFKWVKLFEYYIIVYVYLFYMFLFLHHNMAMCLSVVVVIV